MRIDSVTTSGGVRLLLGDVVTLVGPNNCGKSQFLEDAYQLIISETPRNVLLKTLSIPKTCSFDDWLSLAKTKPNAAGSKYDVISVNQILLSLVDRNALRKEYDEASDLNVFFGSPLGALMVKHIAPEDRLRIAERVEFGGGTVPSDDHRQTTLTPILIDACNEENELDECFAKLFGGRVQVDRSRPDRLCLRILSNGNAVAGPNPWQDLNDQGHGFRSAIGVVLSVLLNRGRILLLDEPEAFLHPAQARQLGEWIALESQTSRSQIIIATHSTSFLTGLLGRGADVQVLRLHREGDNTTFAPMATADVTKLATNPLLSSQRVLETVMHRGVVVCEADADRAFYELATKRVWGATEVFFIHAHNKQTIKDVVRLLRGIHIRVSAIVDIDVLNGADDLRELLLSLDPHAEVDTRQIMQWRGLVAGSIDSRGETEVLGEIERAIIELLQQLRSGSHTVSGAKGAIGRIERNASKWSDIKRRGIATLPEELRGTIDGLLKKAATRGLFIVPVGELESWLDLGTTKKNKWIVPALTHVMCKEIPPALIDFLVAINSYHAGAANKM